MGIQRSIHPNDVTHMVQVNEEKEIIPTDFLGLDETTTNFTILWPSNRNGNFMPS
jgi:hypothetical protein